MNAFFGVIGWLVVGTALLGANIYFDPTNYPTRDDDPHSGPLFVLVVFWPIVAVINLSEGFNFLIKTIRERGKLRYERIQEERRIKTQQEYEISRHLPEVEQFLTSRTS